jgi:hypothetical protein
MWWSSIAVDFPGRQRTGWWSRQEFAGRPRGLPASARVINLCRDLSYLSLGYYCRCSRARG